MSKRQELPTTEEASLTYKSERGNTTITTYLYGNRKYKQCTKYAYHIWSKGKDAYCIGCRISKDEAML